MIGSKFSKKQERRRRALYRRTPHRWDCRVYKSRLRRRMWAAAQDAALDMSEVELDMSSKK